MSNFDPTTVLVDIEDAEPAQPDVVKTSDQTSGLDIFLCNYGGEAEKLGALFKKQNIRFPDLSGLCSKDLEILGITDENVRDKMVSDFHTLPNQAENFYMFRSKLDTADYCKQVLKNTVSHIDNLRTSLEAARIKMIVDPPEDVCLCDEEIFASDLDIKTLDKIDEEVAATIELLNSFGDDLIAKGEKEKPKNTWRRTWKTLTWFSVISAVTWCGYKIYKTGRLRLG